MNFFLTRQCLSGWFCDECRSINKGRGARAAVLSFHPDLKSVDFECPPERGSKPWGFVSLTIDRRPARPAQKARPRPTLAAAARAAWTILTMPKVSQEVAAERAAICESCEWGLTGGRGRYCTICGCGVSRDMKAVLNLANRAERIKVRDGERKVISGCKHPQRSEGKGWALPILPSP